MSKVYLLSVLVLCLLVIIYGAGQVTNDEDSQVSSVSVPSAAPQSVAYELPAAVHPDITLQHTGYTVSFNTQTNCPRWVAWQLTAARAAATRVARADDFRPDTLLPTGHRAEPSDYRDTNYDRGHMCPAADMKWDPQAMAACFLMSNICPQAPTLNRRWWEHLESACRRWAQNEGELYICCGPIYNDARRRKYIGTHTKVRVPNAFYKVVLSLRPGHEKAIGFLYYNRDSRQPMANAACTVDSVEAVTGLNFFCLLNDTLQNTLESSYSLNDWK